jgi:acyl-CoA reductase-like NAD-dependent aldehyde dehydrogenase
VPDVSVLINPATEDVVATIGATSAAQTDALIERAAAAFPAWREVSPAELTPLTAIRLGELALEAGLPEGVFTVVPGRGSVVGQRFVEHPTIVLADADLAKAPATGRTRSSTRRGAGGDRILAAAERGPGRLPLSVNSHSSVRFWTPFGGYKQSGLGRELGPDALYAFTEEKNVFISQD